MAKVKVTEPIKAIGLARQVSPQGSAAQQRAIADRILSLNSQQRGKAFGAGMTVALGKGNKISAPVDTTPKENIAEGTSAATDTIKPPTSSAKDWTLESDPIYQQAIAGGQSAFNVARAQALAEMQNRQTETAQAERELNRSAASSRERLAGNFAARGMAGGAYGALTRAEAEANARQIAAQTSLKDQMAAVSQQYLANFGATGTDWTGTLVGQDYRNQAIQQALSSIMPRYTGV